jgi:hypothetical protein
MKTIALSKWTVVCLSALTVNATANVSAAPACAAGKQARSYTGTVAAVDINDHVLRVNGIFLHKDFDLGQNCGYVFLDGGTGKITGLHPGQKVVVSYHDMEGMRIADHVEQQPMTFAGKVTAMDAKNRTMTVRHDGLEKSFQLAHGCAVSLYDNPSGTLANVHPGNHVTVTYETPYDANVARRIAENNQVFTGELTAINLNKRTVAAKDILSRKDFNVAPDCAIVINGKSGAHLRDIRFGETLQFDYTDANGINTVNRITTVPESDHMTASTTSPHEDQTLLAPRY